MLKRLLTVHTHSPATAPVNTQTLSSVLLPIFLIAILRLWLTAAQPLLANYYPHDDFLFLHLAHSLASGNWLGEYDQLTLVKYPLYSMWIAATYTLGIPLLLSQHILYLAACLTFVIGLKPLLPSPRSALLIFSLLAFNPMSYANGVANRVTREGIYVSLTLLACAATIGLMLRYDRSYKSLLPWSFLLGIAGTSFWLTREEGIWLLPLFFACLGSFLFQVGREKPIRIISGLFLWLIPGIIYCLSAGWITHRNHQEYGAPFTVESKTREFLMAYGALTRVKHENWDPMIPVPRETRMRIYEASPAFRELAPHLEGPIGQKWTGAHSTTAPEKMRIVGGYFAWAFRDAVAAAGYYSSWPHVQEYYLKLASEINTACDEGTIDCLPRRATFAPPWHNEYLFPLFKAFFSIFRS
jgi:hypothetical protein